MARPSKYKVEYNEQVEKLTKLGAIDTEIADFFNICEKTLNNWKKDEEFLQSIKKGKEYADAHIADRLYKRAEGYEHPEDKIFLFEGVPVIVPTIKHYPPDTTADIFWLKNRRPDLWKDRKEVDQTNKNHHTVEYVNVSKDPKFKDK